MSRAAASNGAATDAPGGTVTSRANRKWREGPGSAWSSDPGAHELVALFHA
jgi:hypothetical protein